MWKIHPPHGEKQRKRCQPHRMTLSCDGHCCSIAALRADNLLSSPARLSWPKKKKKRKKWERCSPTPLWIFKTALPTPFPLTKALPSCRHLNIRAPFERKRHLARAFQIKTAKHIFVWKCSKMRFNTLEKQRGDISPYTPYTSIMWASSLWMAAKDINVEGLALRVALVIEFHHGKKSFFQAQS